MELHESVVAYLLGMPVVEATLGLLALPQHVADPLDPGVMQHRRRSLVLERILPLPLLYYFYDWGPRKSRTYVRSTNTNYVHTYKRLILHDSDRAYCTSMY